jgi:hypothetical protein
MYLPVPPFLKRLLPCRTPWPTGIGVCRCLHYPITCKKDKIHIYYKSSIWYLIVHIFLAFPRVVFGRCLFNMPWGFAELLVDRLFVTFRSGFDWTARLVGSVEAILARSLAMLGTGCCICLLLRGVIWSGEGCGSAASTPEDKGKPLEDTFCKYNYLWGPGFFFPATFETFDEWTGLRDMLTTGWVSLSFWEGFLLLGRNTYPIVGRRTRLPVLGRGEFDAEGERSVLLFSNLAGSISADGPCWDVFMMPDVWRWFDVIGEGDPKIRLVGVSLALWLPFPTWGFAGTGTGPSAVSSLRGSSCFHDILGSIPHLPF